MNVFHYFKRHVYAQTLKIKDENNCVLGVDAIGFSPLRVLVLALVFNSNSLKCLSPNMEEKKAFENQL